MPERGRIREIGEKRGAECRMPSPPATACFQLPRIARTLFRGSEEAVSPSRDRQSSHGSRRGNTELQLFPVPYLHLVGEETPPGDEIDLDPHPSGTEGEGEGLGRLAGDESGATALAIRMDVDARIVVVLVFDEQPDGCAAIEGGGSRPPEASGERKAEEEESGSAQDRSR